MATDRTRMLDLAGETTSAQAIALRYRCEYVDLRETPIDHDLFRHIPVDLMFRYNFVPLQGQNGSLDIALADPRNLNTIDELGLLLNKKLRVKVATLSQISELLKKTEQSQRVLEEVTEGFALDVIGDEENQDETLSIDKLSSADNNIAPVIKLVDTTIFNALERRASDIHIESRDQEVAIKYRIDGVLHYAMPPIAKDWHTHHHFPYQGDERTRYRRAARPPGWPFSGAIQRPLDRFPRLHHAHHSRRRCRASCSR